VRERAVRAERETPGEPERENAGRKHGVHGAAADLALARVESWSALGAPSEPERIPQPGRFVLGDLHELGSEVAVLPLHDR
jgi:hypothetical protein